MAVKKLIHNSHLTAVGSFTIGNSNTTPLTRYTGWNLDTKGWPGFFDKFVERARALGFKRFSFHNPAGTSPPNQGMHARQFLEAAAHHPYLIDGLAERIKDGIARGEEWITYLGAMQLDPVLKRMHEVTRALVEAPAQQKAAISALYTDIARAFELPITSGASIGLDSLSGAPDWVVVGARKVRSSMLRVNPRARFYMETWPEKEDDFAIEKGWDIWVPNHSPRIHAPERAFREWAMAEHLVRGELGFERKWICQLSMAPGDICKDDRINASAAFKAQWKYAFNDNFKSWIKDWNLYVNAMGFASALNPQDLFRANLTVKDVH